MYSQAHGCGYTHKGIFGGGGVSSTAVNCSFSAFKIQHMLGFRNDLVSMCTQNRGTHAPSFEGRLHCTAELCITDGRKNGRPGGHEVQFFGLQNSTRARISISFGQHAPMGQENTPPNFHGQASPHGRDTQRTSTLFITYTAVKTYFTITF